MRASDIHALVVDDYATMRRTIPNLLRQIGVGAVEVAEDGDAALEMLRTSRYTFVAIAGSLEPTPWQQVVKAMQYMPPPWPPFLVYAGDRTVVDQIPHQFPQGGWVRVSGLVKPFGAAALKTALSSLLGGDIY